MMHRARGSLGFGRRWSGTGAAGGGTPDPPTVPANPYGGMNLFVSTTGSNTGRTRIDCDVDHPFLTVAYGISQMARGDVLYLRGGTYAEINIDLSSKTDGLASAPYTLTSYPGEWAILDGQHGGSGSYRSVLQSGGSGGITAIHDWIFSHFEVTGGGAADASSTTGAGIYIAGTYNTLRYLYIHDNYASTVAAGAAAGVVLHDPAQDNLVEYCWFQCNGNPFGDVNTGNANLAIYSEYANNTAAKNLAIASLRNEVRYNRFDATGSAGWTPTGICHKGWQRLTGYAYGETENEADAAPNDDSCRQDGNLIHHNLFIGHGMGIRLDQDYGQIYNNVFDMALGTFGSIDSCAPIGTADISGVTRRGSYWPGVYNNTILGNSEVKGIWLVVAKNEWDGITNGTVCPYQGAFVPNNLIADCVSPWNGRALSMTNSATNVTGIQPYDGTRFNASRNFFLNFDSADVLAIRARANGYTVAEAAAAGLGDVLWAAASPSPFVGTTGANRYKVTGSYALDGTYTLANGGLGGSHPYRTGVTIPGYVGAVDPANSGWVDTVLALNDTAALQE